MKTASVADLRNDFPKISRWLQAGEVVRITKRGVHIADLRPVHRNQVAERPDFAARLDDIYDAPVDDTYELLEDDRGDPT